jgi:hypothetical protein
MTQQSSAETSNIWVSGRRASRDRISARHPDKKGIDGLKPLVQEWTYHPVPDIA